MQERYYRRTAYSNPVQADADALCPKVTYMAFLVAPNALMFVEESPQWCLL
jgi:hypothetical protein